MDRGADLAAYLAGLEVETLPNGTVEFLKTCLLDHLGCAIGGLGTATAETGRGYIAAMGVRDGIATVIGCGTADPVTAALVNGLLSHVLIFDDLHRRSKLHPGVAVIPAALAAAEIVRTDGRTLLAAIAAGYEVAARVGVAVDMSAHRLKGWRATGTCGSFGAAAAAARALGLKAEAFRHALAAAAAQASGSWAFQKSGGHELYLAAGTAARNGVVGALLAANGFVGADEPFENADGGFFPLTSDRFDAGELSRDLGREFRLRDTCIKMYPTCHSSQTAIDAAYNLRERHGIGLADVARIDVRAGEITRKQCGWAFEPSPPAKMIFHMGYAMAVMLRNGRVLPRDFDGEAIFDPELGRVARATTVIPDPELTAIYNDRKPAEVTITTRDGRELRERVEFCRGEPENPASAATVAAKFYGLASPFMGKEELAAIERAVAGVDRAADLSGLTRLLRGSAPEPFKKAE
jgi:2-methylcitrate dehydratase PrpD